MKPMRKVQIVKSRVIALSALFLALSASAQSALPSTGTALVTFYSSGKLFLGMPGSKAAFMGKIFDGHRELALLQRRRFITFTLDAGPHVFSTNFWMMTVPEGGSQLDLLLLPDHHYYVGTEFKEVGLGGAQLLLKDVTCEDAQKVNPQTKPLDPKHIRPAGHRALIAETSFPSCPTD
jgi:hypothetical protein